MIKTQVSGPADAATVQTKRGAPSSWRNLSSYLGLLGALLAMIVLFSFLSSHFLSMNTFSTIANQIPDLIVMSVGMTFVLIIAGIDLSVGSLLALSAAVVSVTYLNLHWSPWLAALAGIALATLVGSLTGLVTVAWRIPAFIVSLGVLEMARGAAYQLTDSRTAYIGSIFDYLADPIFFGVSPSFIIAIVVIIVGHLVLTRTIFGRHLIGIGTNEEAVRLSGINPGPYKIAVFALMGGLSGLASLFQIARLEAADPNSGVGMELQVIAAVVIGGTSLMGGRGSIICTFLGALIISVLAAGLAQVGASEPTKRFITGAVIIVAVVLDTYRSHLNKK
ncbi:ABC transporter permease [Enterobacter kobei]|jgi:ribose transport system permease protein|uniref:Ribose ABC transporter permease n=2 Tax=Enterobacter kobei TaxID=208224 RepID=A0AA86M783_9ENTR|nr:ABC transporter permease [Enterobacter kobei]MDF3007179.1 transporter permease [Enterobacter kobei]OLR18514.1 ABC transporter permease [Enterobacter kobei]WNP35190.1 ABC transporter permease [Enterobacter kobei]SIR60218.1 monosaccharide ABC transporter membrane protein, CUT2 family [Enterobacter kobei]BCU53952.1 ribose ABC transporter permease [Enterobacter kobei]